MMNESSSSASLGSFVLELQRCTQISQVSLVHSRIISQHGHNLFLSNHLINTYSKCGCLQSAQLIFRNLPRKNVHSWTVMITAFSQYGQFHQVLHLLRRMQLDGVKPNSVTLTTIFKSCTNLEAGKQIHATISESGMASEVILGSSLVSMYDRCGSLEDAVRAFDSIEESHASVVASTAIISAHVQLGEAATALRLFHRMHLESSAAHNRVTFATVVKACGELGDVAQGRLIHSQILEGGFDSGDVVIATALMNMYGKSRCVEDARLVFERIREEDRDLGCWNCLAAVYADSGFGNEAFECFHTLRLEGLKVDRIHFLTHLTACVSDEFLARGKLLHACISESCLHQDPVLAAALITMYGNCGRVEESLQILESATCCGFADSVAWSSMASVFVHNDRFIECLSFFWRMQQEGVRTEKLSFIAALNSSAALTDSRSGKSIHSCLLELHLEEDIAVATALVSLYGKCGLTSIAHDIFSRIKALKRDAVCWNCLIGAYAESGQASECLELFRFMQQEGVNPVAMSFVKVFAGCSSGGFVDEAKLLFESMETDFGMSMREEHIVCVIDILGKAGQLSEVEEVVKLDLVSGLQQQAAWTSMISSCGDQCVEVPSELRLPNNDGRSSVVYVILSNLYKKKVK